MAIQRLAYTANEIDEKLSLVPSLGITGAQPGDIIRVNQVDSEGRPVSLQGGGQMDTTRRLDAGRRYQAS